MHSVLYIRSARAHRLNTKNSSRKHVTPDRARGTTDEWGPVRGSPLYQPGAELLRHVAVPCDGEVQLVLAWVRSLL